MLLRKISSKLRAIVYRIVKGNPDAFLDKVTGIVHIGANIGQERFEYAERDLTVAWIEPIPQIFAQLSENIRHLKKQTAFQYLLTEVEGQEVIFHISSNNGESSSVFEFGLHKVMRPDISMTRNIKLMTTTLDGLVRERVIVPNNYQALVIDTQGAELLVLRGGSNSLAGFKYVRVEAANFEAYAGGCTIDDITEFMKSKGFEEKRRDPTSRSKKIGRYFEVLFEKKPS